MCDCPTDKGWAAGGGGGGLPAAAGAPPARIARPAGALDHTWLRTQGCAVCGNERNVGGVCVFCWYVARSARRRVEGALEGVRLH